MKNVFGIVRSTEPVYSVNHQVYARLKLNEWELRFDVGGRVGMYVPLDQIELVWVEAAVRLFSDVKYPAELHDALIDKALVLRTIMGIIAR